MRFAVATDRRYSAVLLDYANVRHSSRTLGKRLQDGGKLTKTMVAFVPLAQWILNNREQAVAATAFQPPLPVQQLLPIIHQQFCQG